MRNSHMVVLAIIMTMMMMMMNVENGEENRIREVGIGVILDMDSNVGKSTRICILMALEEFYEAHHNKKSTIIIHPHFRDSKYDNFQAASAAIDLLNHTQVMALLGPQQSSQAHFVLDIANRFKVPVISPATSPALSSKQNPYFIRIAPTSSTQAEPIAALFKLFGWKEVVFIYEDTDFGRGPIPYFFDAMESIGTQVKYIVHLSPSSMDDSILQQLDKLKTMQTRVFVVHMLPSLALRFFKKVNEAGMMAQGYAWIITDVFTGRLHHLDPQELDYMQGVIGVKPYIPSSDPLTNFERKWRKRFHKEYPDMDRVELDMFGIWSYDFVFALATALQRVETKFRDIATSEIKSSLLPMIQNISLKGLSSDFHVVNRQLQTLGYQIVNVIGNGEKPIGFWNSMNGLANRIKHNQRFDYMTHKKNELGTITWPGDTQEIPKSWDANKLLRVGLPALTGFVEFMEAYRDPITNMVYTNGFCMDVFYAVIDAMPYVVNYELIPYENPGGESAGSINDLVNQIVRGKFDMVVGDVAILWNRSNHVDFTFPYLDVGVAMLVPVKVDVRKSAWIFTKPLETKLWITIAAFFIYIGFVIWVLEHHINDEFRGDLRDQLGMVFWFSFSTLVFAHREKIVNNFSKVVVIIWVFVVLVLTSTYTASLASIFTVQKLEPTVTNISELIERGDYIGYQGGSFVEGMLKDMGVGGDKLKKYNRFDEYAKALSDGSRNNGVSAIVDCVPYLKMLMAKNCNKYIMVGPIYNTAGFGFAFRKGSRHVHKFSRAILKVVEGQMKNISNKWFGKEEDCLQKDGGVQSYDKLTLASFKGLFLIAGLSSTFAFVVYILMFLYENKEILESEDSMLEKMTALIRIFYEEENEPLETETIDETPPPGPTISVEHPSEGEGEGEGVSTSLPESVIHLEPDQDLGVRTLE